MSVDTAVNHRAGIEQMSKMTLEQLRAEVDKRAQELAQEKTPSAEKRQELKEVSEQAQARFTKLQETTTNQNLGDLEAKITQLKLAASQQANTAVVPTQSTSTPLPPPGFLKEMMAQGLNVSAQILNMLPIPQQWKSTVLNALASIDQIPLISKLPSASILSQICSFNLVYGTVQSFVQANPEYVFSGTISPTEWQEYELAVKSDQKAKNITALLQAFKQKADALKTNKQGLVISLDALMHPEKVLEPMKTAAEEQLQAAVQNHWKLLGVTRVVFAAGKTSLENGILTMNQSDALPDGSPKPNSDALTLRTYRNEMQNVDIRLTSDASTTTMEWKGEQKILSIATGTKINVKTLREIMNQNKHGQISNIVIADSDLRRNDTAELKFDNGIGILYAANNEKMLKALTQFSALQPEGTVENKWTLAGTTLAHVNSTVNMKKTDASVVG